MLFLFSLLGMVAAQDGKLSPPHSLQPPFRAGGQQSMWHATAGAQFTSSYCRLTPDKQSRTGMLWNDMRTTMTDWEVEVDFSVTGKKSYGGDGFAFWFTEQKGLMGHVFGSADYWKGLVIVFDSYNNDGKGDHPLIAAFDNDGTQSYDGSTDGGPPLASCGMPFRNKESSAKIRYLNGLLTVEIALGASVTPTDKDTKDPKASTPGAAKNYRKCFEVQIELGVDKFFGFTAHTGDVADAHDIKQITTKDLTPVGADLNMVRERYKNKIATDFTKANHETLTANEFQHLALNLLHQNQEGLQMVEDLVNQASVELHSRHNAIINKLDSSAPQIPGDSNRPPSAQSDSTHEWHRQMGDRLANTQRTTEQIISSLKSLDSIDRAIQLQVGAIKNEVTSLAALVREGAGSSSGEGWLNTVLLMVIIVLLAVQALGGCGKKSSGYGKLV